MQLTPRIEIILCADAPMNMLTPETVAAVAEACRTAKVTHLKTPGGTFSPVERWAAVQLAKFAAEKAKP